ncbi:hypothetical protein QTI17_23520 [Variovorax sp. J31P179]|nr:hypothetical protein [Variovorax sp. J31P179]MDM0083571.1 hypothetical protein [Variovorax sp. J31P179]
MATAKLSLKIDTACGRSGHGIQRGRELAARPRRKVLGTQAELPGRAVGVVALDVRARMFGVGHDGHVAQRRNHLAQDFQQLAVHLGGHQREAGHVRLGVRETLRETGRDRVTAEDVGHRHGHRQAAHDVHCRPALRQQDVDAQALEFRDLFGDAVDRTVAVPERDGKVRAFDMAQPGERGAQRRDHRRQAGGLLGRDPSEAQHLVGCVCPRTVLRQRKGERGAQDQASFHGGSVHHWWRLRKAHHPP